MLTKEKIIDAIKAMPEEKFDEIELLLERLLLLDRIESGEEDIRAGRVHTNEEMKEIIKSWFTSYGQNRQATT